MAELRVKVELTPDGYVVACPGSDVVGRGRTETDAWQDFWRAMKANWRPSGGEAVPAPGDRLPSTPGDLAETPHD